MKTYILAGSYLLVEHLYNIYKKRQAVNRANSIPGSRLDLGATGDVVGTDFARPVLKGRRCDINPNPERNIEYCNLTEKLPYKNKEFDVTFCSHVLEHLEASEAISALKEIGRISKKSIIVIPDFWHSGFWFWPNHKCHIWKKDYGLLIKPHWLWSKDNDTYDVELNKKVFEVYQ